MACEVICEKKNKYLKKEARGLVAAVAQAAPRGAVVARRRCWLVASVGVGVGLGVSAQRSPLGWAMGSSQRLAAIAAVSHGKHYYNHTQNDIMQLQTTNYTINVFFVSATLCGVLVAVCAACWRRAPPSDKPEDFECRGVYTVSADVRLTQVHDDVPGPPPAYDSVVDHKDSHILQDVITEACPRCHTPGQTDGELPSYEAAVLLKDTRL